MPISGNFFYESFGGTATITGWSNSGETTLVIPSTIAGYPVVGIGESAFSGRSNLTSITLPSGVSNIASRAFQSCSGLTSFIIPSTVTSIGSYAFSSCSSLTSIAIPNGIAIQEYTFAYCYNLASVTIGNNVGVIGTSAFLMCQSLTSVIIGSGTSAIYQWAFSECTSLVSITLPSSLVEIRQYAFSNSTLLSRVRFLGNAPPTVEQLPFYGVATGAKLLRTPNLTGFGVDGATYKGLIVENNSANTPTFGSVSRNGAGFTVQISNYNGAFTYAGTATASGTVSISNTGLVTVTGVAANTSSTATITTTRTDYVDGSAQVTATSLSFSTSYCRDGATYTFTTVNSGQAGCTNYPNGYWTTNVSNVNHPNRQIIGYGQTGGIGTPTYQWIRTSNATSSCAIQTSTAPYNNNIPPLAEFGLIAGVCPPPPPTVISVSPSTGHISGGYNMTITGTGFTGATAVTIGGATATNLVVVSSTSITATTPARSVGLASVQVTTPNGTSAANTLFSYFATPVILSVTPSYGSIAGGNNIVVMGNNLIYPTSVTVGGTNVPLSDVYSNVGLGSLTIKAPAHAAGVASIAVSNANGSNLPNSLYTYVGVPTVTSISPSSGLIAGGTNITITGTGFVGVTGVTVGGVAITNGTFVNSTTITGTTGAHPEGTASVLVTTSVGTNTANTLFSYHPAPPHSITPTPVNSTWVAIAFRSDQPLHYKWHVHFTSTDSGGSTGDLSHTTYPRGACGSTSSAYPLELPNGVVFTMDVTWSSTSTPYETPVDGATFCRPLTGVLKRNGVFHSNVTFYDLTLKLPVGQGYDSGNSHAYFYSFDSIAVSAPTPTPTPTPSPSPSLSPCLAPANTNAGPFVFPASPALNSIYSFAGRAWFWNSYAWHRYCLTPTPTPSPSPAVLPTVTSVSPSSGSTAGGTSVTITGTNFTGATAVTVGGVAATNVTVVSATSITATTPVKTAGTASILVTTSGGTNTANTLFTYTAPAPALVNPYCVSNAGSSGMNGTYSYESSTGAWVKVGDPTKTFYYDFDYDAWMMKTNSINFYRGGAYAPSLPPSTWEISDAGTSPTPTVTVGECGSTPAPSPLPTITSLSPTSGSTMGGYNVTVTGTNFTGVTNVTVGGITATYSNATATSIDVYFPSNPAGATSVLITTPNGTNAANSLFTYNAPAVPFTFASQSSGGSYSGTGGNSYDSLSGQLYSYGSPETMVFTAGITGTLNYNISGYDMMGGSGVYMSLKVGTTTISTTSSSSSNNGTTAITAGQTVTLTFNGSSMAYSSFSLYMS